MPSIEIWMKQEQLWRCSCHNHGVSIKKDNHGTECLYVRWLEEQEQQLADADEDQSAVL